MSLLLYAAKKAAEGAALIAGGKVLGKVVEKIYLEKSDIEKFEFENHLCIERKNDSKNSQSMVLDDYGNTIFVINRRKYNSNNPSATLLDNNKNVICSISIHRRFFGKCDINIYMNGRQLLLRKVAGYLDKEFLEELGYSIKHKIKGSYHYIYRGDGIVAYIKAYIGRENQGIYLEYKDNREMLVGLAFIMMSDLADKGLKVIDAVGDG